MSGWADFLDDVPWLLEPGADVVVGAERPWDRGGIDALPTLSTLLAAAVVTPVVIDGRPYELLAWQAGSDRSRGWLCVPPPDRPSASTHPLHSALLGLTGGIVEQFGEPSSSWLNQDEVLTESAAGTDVGEVLDEYAWLWEHDGLSVPLDPGEYVAVAVEANGNLTLLHRTDGSLVLFAPDHGLEDVTPLPGCPPFSLMTVDDVPDLRAWVETAAAAWLRA